jgi:acyl carrier protein
MNFSSFNVVVAENAAPDFNLNKTQRHWTIKVKSCSSYLNHVQPGLNEMNRETMAEIWSDVLGRQGVRDSDTFFELGGDSVLAMNLVFRLEEQFGVVVEIFEVFDHPRFGDFLERIDSLMATV